MFVGAFLWAQSKHEILHGTLEQVKYESQDTHNKNAIQSELYLLPPNM